MFGCPEGVEEEHETFFFDFTCVMFFFFNYPFIINSLTLENPAPGLGMLVKSFLLACSLRAVHDCGWTLITLFTLLWDNKPLQNEHCS